MLRSLYLDRIVCALVGTFGLLSAAAFFASLGVVATVGIALVATLLVGYALIGSGDNVSPQATMLHNAAHIAQLFSARWVVMGHTHQPTMQAVSASANYVNLGSWGEDDPPDERTAHGNALGTFLVLRKRADDFFAELMRWDERLGPMTIEQTHPTV
jgi:hypothetical protein